MSQQLLSEEETGKIYRQRKIDVEPAFGHLKACLGFIRFSVRGKQQVHNEMGFALMAVNLRKYRLSKLGNKKDSPNHLKNRRLKIFFTIFGLLFYGSWNLRPKPFSVTLEIKQLMGIPA